MDRKITGSTSLTPAPASVDGSPAIAAPPSVGAPIRIQLRRTRGWKMPLNTVKVDRSSGFGNPFPITKAKSIKAGVSSYAWVVGTWTSPAIWIRDSEAEARDIAVKAYAAWINEPQQASLRERAVRDLRGKHLACWCKGSPCHADVLLEIANGPDGEAAKREPSSTLAPDDEHRRDQTPSDPTP